jgi:hypothetical protein
MGQEGFFLKHEVLGGAVPAAQHGTTYPDLQAARSMADELWWTAVARASHQSIINLSNGQEMVRRPDGSWMWMTLPGAGNGISDQDDVVDVRSERGWRPFRGRRPKAKASG